MGYYLAVFSSVHQVNQIKSLLNRCGEYIGMIRAPQCISTGGCGFALRFEESKLLPVKQAARELGIAVNGIYQEESQENGSNTYTRIE
ncbi:DUF3343 domain-containing protein [Pelotomaculum terephthalicicum JT]|uniref:DUF3343 domain-containing protein n=1 Tax=Pelotomaculum TaxID=191373 RepID=UPI0009D44A82|nr:MULTISPECIES: DUF3343 domain-containing protein [Pelotomaculum]MCG9969322.1 DUF3343 domain-containing protein [Pelotomaculum terephthalicicum JT]OPX89163.1 MAG: hypothetical protein A4E54_01079 [Pelotomaculum sp. PtaB.Bin117]